MVVVPLAPTRCMRPLTPYVCDPECLARNRGLISLDIDAICSCACASPVSARPATWFNEYVEAVREVGDIEVVSKFVLMYMDRVPWSWRRLIPTTKWPMPVTITVPPNTVLLALVETGNGLTLQLCGGCEGTWRVNELETAIVEGRCRCVEVDASKLTTRDHAILAPLKLGLRGTMRLKSLYLVPTLLAKSIDALSPFIYQVTQ